MSPTDPYQQTLAAEHAAVWVLALLGGRARSFPAPALEHALATAYDVHLTRRDHLRRAITAAGQTPVASEPAYAVPRSLVTQEQVSAEALRVERICVTTYGALVAATTGSQRLWAIAAMTSTAAAELGFGGGPEALPGIGRAAVPRRPEHG